jgi:hypothetical protein
MPCDCPAQVVSALVFATLTSLPVAPCAPLPPIATSAFSCTPSSVWLEPKVKAPAMPPCPPSPPTLWAKIAWALSWGLSGSAQKPVVIAPTLKTLTSEPGVPEPPAPPS